MSGSPCCWAHSMTAIPATIPTLFMIPVGNDRTDWGNEVTGIHKIGCLIHLIITFSLWWCYPLVNIHMEHKYLHIFCPFREVYTLTSSPDLLVTNFPIMFLSSPWPSSQTTDHSTGINTESRLCMIIRVLSWVKSSISWINKTELWWPFNQFLDLSQSVDLEPLELCRV